MGDFLFAAMLWLLAAYGGYEIGQADHGRSIAKDCASTGATQIGNTFYSCEPVAFAETRKLANKYIRERQYPHLYYVRKVLVLSE